MLFDQGTLEKMTIQAFEAAPACAEPTKLSKEENDIYVVQVNPDSYTLNHALVYAALQGLGSSGRDAIYSMAEPSTLEFKFLFDGTGVVPPPPSPLAGVPLVGAIASIFTDEEEFDVMEQIEKFDHVVYKHDGKDHRPRKVQLTWGTLVFPCALTSVNYQFTLFKPDGTPLRAQASCSFQEARPDPERTLIEKNSSPDLTHIREVKEGDTLPLMTHRIYGDTKHYIEVARVNKLINFRRLQAGRRLTLPPIAKDRK